ncbi:nucleotide exchange factor GrpE [Actinokineospora sp. NBRC 105648]|uniref:nucleotide exchange factor GrpE n=1 Tax=Actinokineospora sp. NBRC 105648 TaxID=3032206 RepID=UPI0024A406CF|nr:nucleotide exchange factor GrpE [Actinokineospora sp. NBRC 105648]GLZ37528.1 protein GrpE [Actinokineospora sp. NBRC 105648]
MTEQHSADRLAEDQTGDEPRAERETGPVVEVEEEVPAAAGTHAPSTPEAEVGGRHAAEEPELDPSAVFKAQLDERTADLQRLQAEYANYRKRVDRDREAVVSSAKAQVVTDLLSVLDDVERAGAHGDLTGAFKAVAEKLIGSLQKAGLEPFGHEGEPFDPSVHEAVQHNTSTDVDGPTVTGVLRRGYRFGDRVVRAALVAVTDAEQAPAAPADEQN